MLTMWGDKQQFCDGIHRRNFLKIGAFGAGLTLADMLRLRTEASPGSGGSTSLGNAKSAIMVYLPGGPSHMDMYDLKPQAPAEFRGPFRQIDTKVPGVRICEHMPRQAAMWDKLACIRSIVSVDEHSDSLVMTGYSQRENSTANHPSFGSVISRLRSHAPDAGAVPPFVSLRGASRGTEPGFLGISHRPFSSSGQGVDNLRPLPGVSATQVSQRRNLLAAFDEVRREIDSSVEGLDSFTSRAFDMIANGGIRKALDLTRESAMVRDRFRGIESFLTARRLIEAGAGCVTLSYGGWDTHGQNFTTLARQLPVLDRALANLIQDLHDRGLQDDVVTIVWGEFGRTPRINGGAGRDHWAPVMSCMIAGGGLQMGQAIGASTPRGERPHERRCTAAQVLSTIYRAMGIDAGRTFINGVGRPVPILDDREPIRELV